MLRIFERPSPNFGPRKPVLQETRVRWLVVHYTGMATAEAALDRMCDSASDVSAHYCIDEDGAVTRLVPEDKRAWHAGVAYWRGARDINSASVGIELVNPGHAYGYRPFPGQQIDAFIALAGGIMARHAIPAGGVLGHSDVAPGRKTDPGELFPWRELSQHGIGLWPGPATAAAVPDMAAALRALSSIGYAVPLSTDLGADILDPASGARDVITAFQRRFRQDRVDGDLDPETAALIASAAGTAASPRA